MKEISNKVERPGLGIRDYVGRFVFGLILIVVAYLVFSFMDQNILSTVLLWVGVILAGSGLIGLFSLFFVHRRR